MEEQHMEWTVTAKWDLIPNRLAQFSIECNGKKLAMKYVQGFYVNAETGKMMSPEQFDFLAGILNFCK